MNEPATSASLLERLRDKSDIDAWSMFVEIYTPLLERYCRRRGLQAADTADVVQNALIRVSNAMPGFEYRPSAGRFRGWLGAVVRNELLKHWAGEKRRQENETPDWNSLAAEAEADPEWRDEFTRHLVAVACERIRGEFEASTWAAFEATWFSNRDPRQVASELGLTLRAVYIAKSRVTLRLRAEICLIAEDLPIVGVTTHDTT